MIVILMGVAGAGKTVVGKQLAVQLGWTFVEGDEFHSTDGRAKMRQGIPLTDEDREPWLRLLRIKIEELIKEKKNAVVACSALKQRYRDMLCVNKDVRLAYLKVDRSILEQRLHSRQDHFFPAALLDSQLATWEVPQEAWVIEAEGSILETVAKMKDMLEAR